MRPQTIEKEKAMTKSAFVAEFFAAIKAAGMNVTELDAHIANDLIDIKSI